MYGGERQVWQECGEEKKPSGQEVEPREVEARRKQEKAKWVGPGHWFAQKLQYSAHDFTYNQIQHL